MASVPLIQPSTDVGGLPQGPRLDPQDFAHSSTFGLKAVARAAGDVAEELGQIAAEQARIKKTIADEQERVDAETAINLYKVKAADNALDVKNDPSIPADQYATQIEERNRRDREVFGKDLKTHKSRLMYERGAEGIQTAATIHARAEGFATQISGLKVAMDDKRRDLEITAVSHPDEAKRTEAKMQIQADIDYYRAKGFYGADEAIALRAGSRARVQEGEVRRDFRDPTKRQQVIDRLVDFGYTGLTTEKQATLAVTLQHEHDTQIAKAEAKAEKQAKKAYDGLVNDYYTRASPLAGADRLTPAQLEADLRSRGVTLGREDRAAIETQMLKDPDEAPSDPIIRARVMSDVLSMNPQMSENELRQLNAQHRGGVRTINSKDYQSALSHRTSRVTAIETKAESREVRDYHQADQLIRTSLGIPDIIPDRIDPKRLQALAWARQELQNTSWPTNGRKPEKPALDAIRTIIPQAKQMLGDNAVMEMDQIRTLLKGAAPDLAQQPDAAKMGMLLHENQKAGKYSPGQYENIRRLVVEFQRAWVIHFENQAAQWRPVPAAPMAAPPASSGPSPTGAPPKDAGRAGPTSVYTAPVK